VAAFLRDEMGLEAAEYHAGLSSGRRETIQSDFLEGRLPVVAATNAFGLGIDRPDVRMVIHHALPGSLAAYYQEAGRAGRDGRPAEAVLLYDSDDRRLHEHFIRQSDLTAQALSRLYQRLQEAYSEAGAPDPFLVETPEIGREAHLFDTVEPALERLEEAGMLRQGLTQGNRREIVLLPWDEDAVAAVAERLRAHRERQMAQLQEMLDYAENHLDCRRELLLAHFGSSFEPPEDVRADCCDVCAERREVAAFVAEIEEDTAATEEEAAEEDVPPAAELILACTRAFDGLRTVAQMVELLHGDMEGYSRFRDSDFHGRLAGLTSEAITAEIERLLEEERLVINQMERLSAG
ncbi:MAG: helicase-related protein, partial [Candidatus Promineifilaceae bacterium]|nr:helicase-related protein [Candidatus Promineifilaceae bacterium]